MVSLRLQLLNDTLRYFLENEKESEEKSPKKDSTAVSFQLMAKSRSSGPFYSSYAGNLQSLTCL